jgi:hypothetical protein
MVLRSYLVYWWRLGLTHVSNWSLSQLLVPPTALGFIHAKLDLSHGVTKCYYTGLRPLWHSKAEAMLLVDYKIRYENLTYPDHPEWHQSYQNAYNKVSQSVIRQEFGVDVVELCLTKAESQYRSNHRNRVQIAA